MCCQNHAGDEGEENNVESDVGIVEEDSITETTAVIVDEESNPEEPEFVGAAQNQMSPTMTMLEIATQNTIHPEWFDSRLGW